MPECRPVELVASLPPPPNRAVAAKRRQPGLACTYVSQELCIEDSQEHPCEREEQLLNLSELLSLGGVRASIPSSDLEEQQRAPRRSEVGILDCGDAEGDDCIVGLQQEHQSKEHESKLRRGSTVPLLDCGFRQENTLLPSEGFDGRTLPNSTSSPLGLSNGPIVERHNQEALDSADHGDESNHMYGRCLDQAAHVEQNAQDNCLAHLLNCGRQESNVLECLADLEQQNQALRKKVQRLESILKDSVSQHIATPSPVRQRRRQTIGGSSPLCKVIGDEDDVLTIAQTDKKDSFPNSVDSTTRAGHICETVSGTLVLEQNVSVDQLTGRRRISFGRMPYLGEESRPRRGDSCGVGCSIQ